MKQNHLFYPFAFWLMLIVSTLGCEETFVPDTPAGAEEIVVEGYIEAGPEARPPYVVLTRSVPFFATFDPNDLDDIFVHDAEVSVRGDGLTVALTELCVDALSPAQREIASEVLGLDLDTLGFNFCAYFDPTFSLVGETGQTYTLEVRTPAGQQLSALTTIPEFVPITEWYFERETSLPDSNYAQMIVEVADPPGEPNFYRYAVSINGGGYETAFSSVTDDRLFDGQIFEFPLSKPEPSAADIDIETFGLYELGDTVSVRWLLLDEAHYRFWNTLEFNAANQGPFSSYTRIADNIKGGLGIWGGYAVGYYEAVVRE